MEIVVILYVLKYDEVEIVFKFNGWGIQVIYDTGDLGNFLFVYLFCKEAIGISALYRYETIGSSYWSILVY